MIISSNRPVRRIGLSMRIISEKNYSELRDSIAQDWGEFLKAVIPEVAWMGIPNVGTSAREFVEAWELDALILTGGDDIGKTPARDETERALLSYFTKRKMPVYGVCRGMQLIHTEYGGELTTADQKLHVSARHSVHFTREIGGYAIDEKRVTVNSFHTLAIEADQLAEGLIPLAISDEGHVEAMSATSVPLVAVMWHPERELMPNEWDRSILRQFFGYSSDKVPLAS